MPIVQRRDAPVAGRLPSMAASTIDFKLRSSLSACSRRSRSSERDRSRFSRRRIVEEVAEEKDTADPPPPSTLPPPAAASLRPVAGRTDPAVGSRTVPGAAPATVPLALRSERGGRRVAAGEGSEEEGAVRAMLRTTSLCSSCNTRRRHCRSCCAGLKCTSASLSVVAGLLWPMPNRLDVKFIGGR